MKSLLGKPYFLVVAVFLLLQTEAFATNAPSNLVATGASSSQVNLTWTDNSSDETGFTLVFDTNSGLTHPTYDYMGGANTTSYSHTGRSAATTYYYKIKAEGNPDSAWTTVKSATTAPSNLAATGTSSSAIQLTWTGNGSNTAITGYTIAYATNSSFSGAAYQYVAGAATASYSHTGLYAGTTYYYKIKAEGTADPQDSPFTAHITATTSAAAPNAPSGLGAVAASSSQINLSWTDNSSNETGFEIKRATDSAFTQSVTWRGGIQGSSYSDTGLSASTTYYYKVRAEGATQDSAYSAAVSATTNPSGATIPNAPSGLNATATSSQATLTWTDNSTNETGFEVKRATDSAFTRDVMWIGGISDSNYTNTGLSPSTTYYYKVRAEGTAGKSAYSAAISVTTGGSPGSLGKFAGINAWMPYQIGPCKFYGKLTTNPNDPIWADIQASGVQIMRYGGNGVDECADPLLADTRDQYVWMVNAMRSKGIEPVLQVPVYGGRYNASQAADLVEYVNVTHGLDVEHWIIGNEPDLPGSAYGGGYTTANQVAAYFKPFASAMKAVDPTIKIIGPETAWYNEGIINGLTSCDDSSADITGKDPNGHYYVDILSFHIYPFDGTQTQRSEVISKLMAPNGFHDDLGALKTRLDDCNADRGRTGDSALKMAVTEANINYSNPSGDWVGGLGAKSFIGGQLWAELMGIALQQGVEFVTFWSTIEGNGLSYISSNGATKWATYYHFDLWAKNFRGSPVAAAETETNVKAFATEDVDQIAVMIMNQSQSTSFNFTVRLDNSTITSSNLKINVDAGVAAQYSDTLATESSLVLIFNASGALKKKIEYKRYGHADANLPPAVTTYP